MGLAQIAIDILLAGYVFFSWTTIGYIFLRTGWPKIRVLPKEVRLGWALVITLALNITIIISSLLLAFLLPFTSFRGYLLLNLIVFSFTGIAVLTARRKLFTGRTVSVSVPKSVGEKITTAESGKTGKPRKGDIIISKKGMEKLDELSKSFDAKRAAEKKVALEKRLTAENKIENLMGMIPKKDVQAEMKMAEPKAVKVEAKKVQEKDMLTAAPPKPKEAGMPKKETPVKQGGDIFGRLRGIFGGGGKVKSEKPAVAESKEPMPAKIEDPVFSRPASEKIAPVPKPEPVAKPEPAKPGKWAAAKPAAVKQKKVVPAPMKVVDFKPGKIDKVKKPAEAKSERPEGALARLRMKLEKKEATQETKEKDKKAEEKLSGIEIIDLPAPKIEEGMPAPLPGQNEFAGKKKGLFDRLSNVLKKQEVKPGPIIAESKTPSVMEALERKRLMRENAGQRAAQPPKPEQGEIKKAAKGEVEADIASEPSEEKEQTEKIIKDKKDDILRSLKKIMNKELAPESPEISLEGKSTNPLWKNFRDEVNLKARGKLHKAAAREKGIGWNDMGDVEELSKMDEQIEEISGEISKSDVDEGDPLYRLMKLSGELPDKKKKKGKNDV
ncbi:MAG: hypothetical protein ABID38_04590 [Candidatus Diapherotrites archaeon]